MKVRLGSPRHKIMQPFEQGKRHERVARLSRPNPRGVTNGVVWMMRNLEVAWASICRVVIIAVVRVGTEMQRRARGECYRHIPR